MHTVVLRNDNVWAVVFMMVPRHYVVAKFSGAHDAYSFCSYLNGGKLMLSDVGHNELDVFIANAKKSPVT